MTDWTTLIGALLGGGAIATTASEVIRRKIPSRDTTADRETKHLETERLRVDEAAARFQLTIQAQLDQVRSLHETCENIRRLDQEQCQKQRSIDREEVATLRGQVEFLRGSLDNLKSGAPNAQENGKGKSSRKRAQAKAC